MYGVKNTRGFINSLIKGHFFTSEFQAEQSLTKIYYSQKSEDDERMDERMDHYNDPIEDDITTLLDGRTNYISLDHVSMGIYYTKVDIPK